jgi:anthranilate phosphoribosyltransferase
MLNQFSQYIKAVGTGIKHNCDLNLQQMEDATTLMLNKMAYPEQISAFLLGWRIKPETIEEFQGVVKSFDNFIKRVKIDNSIELGYPYDGKKNNPYLFSLMAKFIKKYNLNIVVTGDDLVPAKDGITVKNIVSQIKISSNLHYFNRADIFKELSNLTQLRNNLGIRTGLNTVERLINPAKSDYAFIGVFHKPFMEKYAQIFGNRYKKLVIVKGNEGTAEIFSKCQYWIVENGKITEHKIDPKDFGINYTKSWDRITLEQSLENITNPSDELLKIVKLNAALILFVSNKTSSIKEGYKLLQKYN